MSVLIVVLLILRLVLSNCYFLWLILKKHNIGRADGVMLVLRVMGKEGTKRDRENRGRDWASISCLPYITQQYDIAGKSLIHVGILWECGTCPVLPISSFLPHPIKVVVLTLLQIKVSKQYMYILTLLSLCTYLDTPHLIDISNMSLFM